MVNSNIVCCGLNNFDKRFGDMSCTSVHPWNLDENVDGVQCNADFVKMPENKREMVPNDDGVCNISNCKTKKKKTTFVLDKTSLIYSVQSFHVTMTLKDVFKVMKTDVHFLTTLVVLKNLNIEFLQFLANSVKKYAGACVTFNEIKMPKNKKELDDDVDKNKKKSTTFIFDGASLLPSFPVIMPLEDVFKMIQTDVRFMTTLVALKNLTIEFLQFLANSVNQCAGAYITFNEVTNNGFCNKQIVVSTFGRVGRSKKNLKNMSEHFPNRDDMTATEAIRAIRDVAAKAIDEIARLTHKNVVIAEASRPASSLSINGGKDQSTTDVLMASGSSLNTVLMASDGACELGQKAK